MDYLNAKLNEIFGTRRRPRVATACKFRHVLTWPNGAHSEIRLSYARKWVWGIPHAPGVTGLADTLREAIEDATSDGARYSKERRA